MQKSKIEWTDFTINPVKGLCPMACPYCYARAMYKRFRWNPEIRLEVDSFLPFLETTKIKPSRIFVGSTMELFGDWVKPEWMQFIFERVKLLSEHTFIFLTKQPQNLKKWSPFPDNCWVGVSLDLRENAYGEHLLSPFNVVDHLHLIEAKVKFLSFEPLMNSLCIGFRPRWWSDEFYKAGINWLIIGAETKSGKVVKAHAPKVEWIKEIVEAADKAGVPVFLKDNLNSIFAQNDCDGFNHNKQLFKVIDNFPTRYHLRQEFPELKEVCK